MLNPWAILLIIVGMTVSYVARKLTLMASIAGGVVAALCYLGADFTGLSMLGAFFILASIATRIRITQKQVDGLAETGNGRRNVGQVIANGGVAAFVCALSVLMPGYQPSLEIIAAASLSAAAADSVSSEIGNAFGSKFINVLSFKTDKKGLDGVISPEGTLAGLIASLVIALIYAIGVDWNVNFIYIVAGGTAGNFFDSFLGAYFERKHLLDNNHVNFLNTAFGAMVAFILMVVFG